MIPVGLGSGSGGRLGATHIFRVVRASRTTERAWRSAEVLADTVDFEAFRPVLLEGLGYGDGAKGGRPPFEHPSGEGALPLIRRSGYAALAA